MDEIILSEKPLIRAYNCDCMDFMKDIPDNHYGLSCVDPPYGIGGGLKGGRPFSMLGGNIWDTPPDDIYFNKLFKISKNQIIWGGNYFKLGRTRGFIVWHKENDGRDFSECEYAWTSFEQPSRIYKKRFIGKKESDHPTEKPVALYRWLLQNYAKPGQRILDTHGGSFSSAIACYIEGYDVDICELDVEYFEAAVKRFKQATCQTSLKFS